MSSIVAEPVPITVDDGVRVSGLLQTPSQAAGLLCPGPRRRRGNEASVHGGGRERSLRERGIASLRYQFPYMERGGKRPDPPAVAHATVRAAVDAAQLLLPNIPLIAGGKSFGGRMTSQAQAKAPLPGVRGLAFLGFPSAPGRPAFAGSRQASI